MGLETCSALTKRELAHTRSRDRAPQKAGAAFFQKKANAATDCNCTGEGRLAGEWCGMAKWKVVTLCEESFAASKYLKNQIVLPNESKERVHELKVRIPNVNECKPTR